MTFNRLIFGSSGLGSRVSFARSVDLVRQAYSLGIRNFDTAPTYGAGYAERILAVALKNSEASIATKFGQRDDLSVRGIAKKIYRAPRPWLFFDSFQKSSPQAFTTEQAWARFEAEASFERSQARLDGLSIKYFFLHAPPIPVLATRIEEELLSFRRRGLKFAMGLAEPCNEDLRKIAEGYKSEVFDVLQVSLLTIRSQFQTVPRFNVREVWVNQIFSTLKVQGKNANADEYFESLKQDFFSLGDWKAVVGCNSLGSVGKLTTLYSSLFGASGAEAPSDGSRI
jgi:aryl-alcohol dehydrogenase-like predicted oxidoreductase